VTDPERLELAKRRELSELIGDTLDIYKSNFGTLVAIAAAVVVPVQLIVAGIGLEELTAGYKPDPSTAERLIPIFVSFLVIAPLIAAATIGVLRDLSKGEQPRFGRSLQLGLDAFAPIFGAVVLAALGIGAGLLLIVPGIYIAVRLAFVAQAVVIDDKRGPDALRATWELTLGSWWRVFATILTANLIALLPASVVLLPLEALAKTADREAIVLAGRILTEVLTAPFVALISTLLFFDLRARSGPQAERLF
jgi:hypothetical protein